MNYVNCLCDVGVNKESGRMGMAPAYAGIRKFLVITLVLETFVKGLLAIIDLGVKCNQSNEFYVIVTFYYS